MSYKIAIEPVLNGFIARVGCQTLAYQSASSLLADLGRYLDNPHATEKEFRAHALNRRLLLEPQPGCDPAPPPETSPRNLGNALVGDCPGH